MEQNAESTTKNQENCESIQRSKQTIKKLFCFERGMEMSDEMKGRNYENNIREPLEIDWS